MRHLGHQLQKLFLIEHDHGHIGEGQDFGAAGGLVNDGHFSKNAAFANFLNGDAIQPDGHGAAADDVHGCSGAAFGQDKLPGADGHFGDVEILEDAKVEDTFLGWVGHGFLLSLESAFWTPNTEFSVNAAFMRASGSW